MKHLLAIAACGSVLAAGAATNEELARLVAEDVSRPVRPVGIDGQAACWNGNATWFMHPPVFAFAAAKGADGYRVRIVDAAGKVRCFEQKEPVVSLEKFWMELPTGRTEVWCDAYRKWATWTVARNFRVFWKMAPYAPGTYPKAPRSYADAARACCEYLLNHPWLKTYAETGKPDSGYRLNCYPSRMDAAIVRLMVDYARFEPSARARALGLARAVADHLLSLAQPAGAPLAHFTPTYFGERLTAKEYAGMNMLEYPARVARAFACLYEMTKDEKYLNAAKGMAETYRRLQGQDGSWYLKMYEKDGRPVTENRLLPARVVEMVDTLAAVTGDTRWNEMGDRALAFYAAGPLRDWNWEGQFEDTEPTDRYVNLTMHPACSLAIILAKRWPNDPGRVAQARELVRFAEDQFVIWDRPKGADANSLLALHGNGWDAEPAVVEQYFYREAVDASAAEMVNACLALYEATHNPLDLAKARTLGDAIVRVQKPDGRIQTIWSTDVGKRLETDWLCCMAESVWALMNLSRFGE